MRSSKCKLRKWVVLALCCIVTPLSSAEIQCSVKLEACGSIEQNLSPLSKIKEGVCLKLDLASLGKKPSGLYYSNMLWIGASVSGNTLVLGKGEAKTGLLLECTWNTASPKPVEQINSLKKSIPQILKNETLKKHFPGIEKIDASGLSTVSDPDKKCIEAIMEFGKKKPSG